MDSVKNKIRMKALRQTYVSEPQFGLVLGAGVTVDSGVPTYEELALGLMERAADQPEFSGSPDWVHSFVYQQRVLLAEKTRKTVEPDQVVLYVRSCLGDNEKLIRRLVREVLYKDVAARKIVPKEVFNNNPTLDTILSFCAAKPGSVLAPASNYRIEANGKIGGILTTNYDNLLEGAFHTKYQRPLLHPVGRPSSRKSRRNRRRISVFHIHGYVGYRERISSDIVSKGPDPVIAEDDYFQIFYDPLGFGSYTAMNFLGRFPCLFIGSRLVDKNLRRFLFHLSDAVGRTASLQKKFAILKQTGNPDDELTDRILLSYGVETIWISTYDEIKGILQKMYTAVTDIKEADWEYVSGYRW